MFTIKNKIRCKVLSNNGRSLHHRQESVGRELGSLNRMSLVPSARWKRILPLLMARQAGPWLGETPGSSAAVTSITMLNSEASLELNTADGVRIAEGDAKGGRRPATADESDPRAGPADEPSVSTLSDSPVTGVLFSLTGGTWPRLGLRLRVVRTLAEVQLLAEVLSLRMRMWTGPGMGT